MSIFIALNGWKTDKCRFGNDFKESVRDLLEILSQQFSGETEENSHKLSQDRQDS